MTDATNTNEKRLATDRNTRLTAAAFVVAAIGAAILVIAAWAVALPHLRVFVIDQTETAGPAIAWLRALQFARIISVLVLAIASGLIVSSTIGKSMESN